MTSPFLTASQAEAVGQNRAKLSEFEGALCIFEFQGIKTVTKKKFKPTDPATQDVSIVDIDCVRGVPAGTSSLMPSQNFGEAPAVLEDMTGVQADGVAVFGGWINGSFRNLKPGTLVVGRIMVEGRAMKDSDTMRPSWVLKDPSPEEIQEAAQYLTNKNAQRLQPPPGQQATPIPPQPAPVGFGQQPVGVGTGLPTSLTSEPNF